MLCRMWICAGYLGGPIDLSVLIGVFVVTRYQHGSAEIDFLHELSTKFIYVRLKTASTSAIILSSVTFIY